MIARLAAAAIAITGATVYTGSGEPLEDATVLIDGARVVAVGSREPLPRGVQVIEARGAVVTPGLIDACSRLGLEEIATEATSIEASSNAGPDSVEAALRALDGYDPRSTTLRWALAGGLASAAVVPLGGLVSGQSAWVDLSGPDPVRRASLALHVRIGAYGGEPGELAQAGARTRALARLRELLADARLYQGNRGAYLSGRLRELSTSAANLQVLARALSGELPVVFHVDRGADIARAIEFAQKERLRAVLAGAAEGWLVAERIAASGFPVILDPLDNLPASFDKLRARDDNAVRLHTAGVRIAFSSLGDAHRVHRLRHAAGNAVALGMPRAAALAAITRVPAEIFDLRGTGVLRAGAFANLVVWNGDPLELTTWPVRAFVRGREIDLDTRQDALTRRYLAR